MNRKKLIRMRALFVVTAVCVCVSGFISCENDDGNDGGKVHDPSKPVTFTSFMPDSGRIRERVILDGSNFGTDVSNIKVFFNTKEAKVISSSGTRILALVPRLPGDTCILSVEAGDKRATCTGFFRYKVEPNVSTLAGTGTGTPLIMGELDKTQFRPLYMGVDHENNIFVTTDANIVRLNVEENMMEIVANGGNFNRLQLNANADNVIMLGCEGSGNAGIFYSMDSKENWTPKMRFIKEWIQNGYALPSGGPGTVHENYETHHHCLYCYADGYYYTRYNGGQIVKIDPKTWVAEIIYKTNPGVAYGMAFHPERKTEVWLGYESGYGDQLSNSICVFDVTDPDNTFRKISSPINGGHRDGPIDQAQFQGIRQINFDPDGSLFIGEVGNHCIRRIDTSDPDPSNAIVETIIGIPQQSGYRDGTKEYALFSGVHGIVSDSEGVIYISDWGNYRIRRLAIE
jgi:hypothetical protein